MKDEQPMPSWSSAASRLYWRVSVRFDPPGEKCGQCGADGFIHYTSPTGKRIRERCRCRWRKSVYFPEELRLMEIDLGGGEPQLWYYAESGRRLSLAGFPVYGGEDFSKIDRLVVIFGRRAEAEAYAAWLNENRAFYIEQFVGYDD